MTSSRSRVCLIFAVLSLGVASCGNIKSSRVPGGGHLITCSNGMKDCVGRAAKLCGDDGYTILKGVSRSKLLGGSSSSYRSMSEIAELEVVCGVVEEEELEGTFQLPERTDEPVEPEPDAAAAPPPPACTPGATQKCFGPAACEGGQVCRDDGTGFEPCDCGSPTSETGGSESESASESEGSSGAKGPSSLDPGGRKGGAPKIPAPGKMPSPTPL